MRYANKSPEERKPAKFSQAACLNEDTCSSSTDANADLPGEANPHRLSQNRTDLKKTAPGSDSGHAGGPHGAQGDVWQGCESDERNRTHP